MSKTPINRTQGRSLVLSTGGIVASEHPMASQAGADVLAAGGHAVDAAIAANAVMGVVCPMMCGVGGDLFAIVSTHDGALHGINASGWAPAQLSPDILERSGASTMPQSGAHSVTVPGAVAGWALLHERFGRRPFGQLLEPAIELAAAGVPIAEITSTEWQNQVNVLHSDPGAANTFLPQGRPPLLGEVFRNPDLAWTYRRVAEHGPRDFYAGDIARRLVAGLTKRGSIMSAADLREFSAEWVAPLSVTYRGWQVIELPPNAAGIAALMMLNIIETIDLGAAGPADSLHTMIEAKKLAYADMLRHVADARWGAPPADAMLGKEYARSRAALIDRRRASASATAGDLPVHAGDTTYLAVADREGNMVSLIQSNYASFGSGIVAEGTGFALQNRGALFTLDRAHPNVLAPRKRPLHTIIPAFMSYEPRAVRGEGAPQASGGERGGGPQRLRMAFGIMGGWNQSQAHAQFVSNIVDRGMNIQAALEAPRFTKLTFDGRDVAVEQRIADDVRRGLAARGHELDVQGEYCSWMGGGQAVMRDAATGVNYGASDPRKDGCAVPELVRKNGTRRD